MKRREKLSTHAFVLNDDGNGCCCVQLFNIPEFTCYRIDWSWELPSANDFCFYTKIATQKNRFCISFRLRFNWIAYKMHDVCVGWLVLVVGIFAQFHVNWNVETHVSLVHHNIQKFQSEKITKKKTLIITTTGEFFQQLLFSLSEICQTSTAWVVWQENAFVIAIDRKRITL